MADTSIGDTSIGDTWFTVVLYDTELRESTIQHVQEATPDQAEDRAVLDWAYARDIDPWLDDSYIDPDYRNRIDTCAIFVGKLVDEQYNIDAWYRMGRSPNREESE